MPSDCLNFSSAVNRAAFFKGLLADWWLLAGIVTYALELIIWLRILAEVPISVAFPIASANFLGVALAGHFLLKEKSAAPNGPVRVLITMGVALVAGST